MLRFTQGNLLDAQVDAIVNTVNTVGAMGKGIALQVKEAYPAVDAAYRAACERGDVQIGRMHVVRTQLLHGPRFVINFPTKEHWRQPSKFEYVTRGLKDLRRVVGELGIKSIAVPPLGCGSGGLDWAFVKPEIVAALDGVPDLEVVVYEPTAKYQTGTKRSGVEALTPARALIVEAVRRYAVLGFECTNLEVQKLAYFAQRVTSGLRLPDVLDLQFKAHIYGPYSDKLRHVLTALDGSYLHSQKRLADAKPLDPIVLDLPRLAQLDRYWSTDEAARYRPVIERTETIIDGFQTPFLMELLATVDWVVREAGVLLDAAQIREQFANWAGNASAAARKLKLFSEADVELARAHLARQSDVLYPA